MPSSIFQGLNLEDGCVRVVGFSVDVLFVSRLVPVQPSIKISRGFKMAFDDKLFDCQAMGVLFTQISKKKHSKEFYINRADWQKIKSRGVRPARWN